jgi:hypothetical protein
MNPADQSKRTSIDSLQLADGATINYELKQPQRTHTRNGDKVQLISSRKIIFEPIKQTIISSPFHQQNHHHPSRAPQQYTDPPRPNPLRLNYDDEDGDNDNHYDRAIGSTVRTHAPPPYDTNVYGGGRHRQNGNGTRRAEVRRMCTNALD